MKIFNWPRSGLSFFERLNLLFIREFLLKTTRLQPKNASSIMLPLQPKTGHPEDSLFLFVKFQASNSFYDNKNQSSNNTSVIKRGQSTCIPWWQPVSMHTHSNRCCLSNRCEVLFSRRATDLVSDKISVEDRKVLVKRHIHSFSLFERFLLQRMCWFASLECSS